MPYNRNRNNNKNGGVDSKELSKHCFGSIIGV